MPDYTNGKIYVIRNHKNNMVYIGSTIQTLAQRMGKHRIDYKKKPTRKLFQAINEIGIDKFYIELVEDYPCKTREQLCRQEGHFIRQFESYNFGYNGVIAGQTRKEWLEENKEKITEYKKAHYEVNKKAIAEKQKEYREANKQAIAETSKIYRENNTEKISEYKKIQYEANKQVILQKIKEEYICDICNCELTLSHKIRHEKTKKHLKMYKKITPTTLF